ncbi:MAG: HPr family phosphocarrier protein [Tissierellia bacterium]|jgi:phosphotransferase system HPr (HPr) family protein|nr:HPr family phosphocarrier protein [Bacillota bacterium]NLK58216.1 HPr family phosphocarrier protein [Tissierellia bacterium]
MHETQADVVVANAGGLHARAASRFVRQAVKYRSIVSVVKDDVVYNGKSIMGILSMQAFQGDTITIRAIGDDADRAVEELTELVRTDTEE